MANIAKPTMNLSADQIDAVVGKARYERSQVFHGHLQALVAPIAKLFGGVNTGHGTPATS